MTAKLNHVNARRATPGKPDPICRKCLNPIEVGQAYVWFKFYNSGRQCYHKTAVCMPTDADRESNPKRAAHTRATALIDEAQALTTDDDPATLANLIRDAIAEVDVVIEEIESSLDAWSGTNFEQGEMAQAFESSRDSLDEWKTNAESWANQADELTTVDDPGDEPDEPQEPHADHYETDDGEPDHDAYTMAYDEYLDERENYETEFNAWTDASNAFNAYQTDYQSLLDEIETPPELDF
jgi:hypothetical protein